MDIKAGSVADLVNEVEHERSDVNVDKCVKV